MASDDELSTLERSLLDEEYGGEEAPEVEEQVHGDIQEKVVDKPLVEPHVRHPAEGEIHFLVDEIQERLDREMERVLFTLQHPLAGKRVRLLTVFVRAVVQAYARQMGKIANVSEQQLVEPITPVLPLPERIPVVPHVSAGGVIPPPPVASAKGLTFPEIPHEEPYQLSALDQETAGAEPEERRVNVIHIPLMLDEERNEIVAAAEYDEEENVYRVHEPELDEHNHAVLMQLKKDISDVALLKNQRALQKQITKSAKKIGVGIDDEDYFVLKYYLVRDLA